MRNALLLLGPYGEGLAERVAKLLPSVERLVALHTPAYYAVEGTPELEEAARAKEVRFAVRESPTRINFYRVRPSALELYASKEFTPQELEVVKRYEASKA
ncbi:MAG: hypothetical protein TU35_001840 [Thermoproteus sp. AZ2]|uniref:Uncharacterized protein n=1 Tax=Thermoproteus sp. AZ2 TaxID=1609232 RepID=A0ACC6UZ93_9CREN